MNKISMSLLLLLIPLIGFSSTNHIEIVKEACLKHIPSASSVKKAKLDESFHIFTFKEEKNKHKCKVKYGSKKLQKISLKKSGEKKYSKVSFNTNLPISSDDLIALAKKHCFEKFPKTEFLKDKAKSKEYKVILLDKNDNKVKCKVKMTKDKVEQIKVKLDDDKKYREIFKKK